MMANTVYTHIGTNVPPSMTAQDTVHDARYAGKQYYSVSGTSTVSCCTWQPGLNGVLWRRTSHAFECNPGATCPRTRASCGRASQPMCVDWTHSHGATEMNGRDHPITTKHMRWHRSSLDYMFQTPRLPLCLAPVDPSPNQIACLERSKKLPSGSRDLALLCFP